MSDESTVRVIADLPGAIAPGQQYVQLTPEEIAWAEEEKAKEAVCKEVVQNVGLSENFMQSRGFQQIWDTNPLLRQYLGSLDNPELIVYRIRPTRVRFMKEWALEYYEVPLS